MMTRWTVKKKLLVAVAFAAWVIFLQISKGTNYTQYGFQTKRVLNKA